VDVDDWLGNVGHRCFVIGRFEVDYRGFVGKRGDVVVWNVWNRQLGWSLKDGRQLCDGKPCGIDL
jgi:hypothetical protein